MESILALQKKACEDQGKPVELELVIMTSDDTHSRTQDLLDDHGFFGMQRHQLHLLKQEKVNVCVHSIQCVHSVSMWLLSHTKDLEESLEQSEETCCLLPVTPGAYQHAIWHHLHTFA